jgi:hypothetical protein
VTDVDKFDPQTKPTKQQVRAIWDAHPKPSARKVATLIEQRGGIIHWRTVARWKKDEWKEDEPAILPGDDGKPPNHRAVNKVLREELAKGEAVSLAQATRAATSGIESAIMGGTMTDDDLTRIEAARKELRTQDVTALRGELEKERLIYNIILLREAQRKANVQVLIPKDTGHFVAAFTDDAKAVAAPPPIQPTGPGPAINGSGQPLMIEGEFSVVEDSEMGRAIEDFLAKENA